MEVLQSITVSSGASSPAGLMVFVAFLAVGALYALYLWLLPKPLPGIPYNAEATKSLLGDVPSLAAEMKSTGEFATWLAKQVQQLNSPVCQVFVQPFKMPWILVGDFHEAQDILLRRREFDKPKFLTDGLLPLGDFHARYKTGVEFRARRMQRQDLMAPTFLHNYMGPAAHATGLKLLSLFDVKMRLANGRPFAVRDDFGFLALDVMTQYAFGEHMQEPALRPQIDLLTQRGVSCVPRGGSDELIVFPEAHLTPFLEAVHKIPDVLESVTLSWAPELSFWWTSKQAWYRKLVAGKEAAIPGQLRKAMQNCEDGRIRTALDHLMMREQATAGKQGREAGLFTRAMADEIFADVLTGYHTTGSAMGWFAKYATAFPAAQSRLRAELYAAIPQAVEEERAPSFEELRAAHVPYLEAFLAEARRLVPFSIVRETTQATDILGHAVPKGAQVLICSGGPGFLAPSLPVEEATRSETAKKAKRFGRWDESQDMKRFDPDRWLVTRDDGTLDFDGAAGPQLGFGLGIRQCWGKRMAHQTVRTVMALMIWHLDFLPIPDQLHDWAGIDGISRQPVRVYVRMQRTTPPPPRSS